MEVAALKHGVGAELGKMCQYYLSCPLNHFLQSGSKPMGETSTSIAAIVK